MAPNFDFQPQPSSTDLSPQALIQEHYKANPQLDLSGVGKGMEPPGIRHSGPQGKVEPLTIIDDPAAWTAKDYPNLEEHIYRLTEADVAELDAAVQKAEATGKEIQEVTKEDFPLPTLAPKLVEWRDEISSCLMNGVGWLAMGRLDEYTAVRFGRGWYLIRGVPVQRYTQFQSVLAYWGFGLYWGKTVSQNKKGHIVGHVKDIGHDPKVPDTRVYATALAQPWHTDSSDIVGLLCLKTAKSGGESSWSSSVSVHNELLRIGRADLVQTLMGDWWVDRKGEIPAGLKPYHNLPIMTLTGGYLTTAYQATYYELAQRHPEVPRLTDKQREAVSYFNAIAKSDALRLDFVLQPGDIQLLHNHQQLHTRTQFEDHPEFEKRRHLLRLWICPPAPDRPLDSRFTELFGSVEPGNRGGIRVPGYQLTTPFDGE